MPAHSKIRADCALEGDDVTIAYGDLGEKSGDPVLLLHPFLDSCTNWNAFGLVDQLVAKGFRAIFPDLRAHGKSSKPHDKDLYGKKHVQDMIRLLDQLGIKEAHVVGYSLGSEVAIALCVAHAERVKSLVAGGSGWSDKEAAEFYDKLGNNCCGIPGYGLNFLMAARVCWYPCCCPCCMMACCGTVLDMKATMACAAGQPPILDVPEADMQAIRVPVCGVAGEKDPERKSMERMTGVVPQYALTIIPGKGHEMATQTHLYNETVLAHLVRVRDGESPTPVTEMAAPTQVDMPGIPVEDTDCS